VNLEEMVLQCTADSERWFPESQSLAMLTLCLAGEVGEVANLVKKLERGTHTIDEERLVLAEEIIDVQIYLANLMGLQEFADVDWKAIWEEKRAFNEKRFGDG
jgi:NTP pyrophosphatase (non-canonical NTP hydrolase)